MGKRITHDGPIQTAVLAWMCANSIDPNMVRSYKIERHADGEMWIDVSMWVNDVAPPSVTWPKRVRDAEGDEYRHQGDGAYRMVLGKTGELGTADFTLKEIRAVYEGDGQYEVIEA